ncbi:class I SAM-dependent methyltransferase [Sinimarinibacterium flocculans]|jgi:O-methyltransferase involved in polyketide biosynthesis|uniref:class I SAM-dependent methyltransferase n=1 Tax=Sinimarinibacterium flocculans TaxID=985250 RepID=UPI003515EEAD
MNASASISPTAHYTGLVWARHGLSHPALATTTGRLLFYGFKPVILAAQWAGVPAIDSFLLTRHRLIDLRLDEAIRSGRVSQVIEIACGLSPRGWRFNQRYGEALTYIEADLPGMAQRKREALARMGGLRPGHRVVDIDALADSGPMSLEAVAASLDRSRGVALITEGLLNYFSEAHVRSMWRRFSSVMRQFPQASYWSDIGLSGDMGGSRVAPFVGFLSAFVRGRVHLHFRTPADAEAALRECGFTAARAMDPGEFASALGNIPGGVSRRIRVIEAATPGPLPAGFTAGGESDVHSSN